MFFYEQVQHAHEEKHSPSTALMQMTDQWLIDIQ